MVKTGRGGRRNIKLSKPISSPPSSPTPPENLAGKTLPEDLITEILYRTPVRSLLRFKCVCKSWLFRITHPRFIFMHLKFSEKRLICNAFDSTELTRRLVCYVRVTQLPVPLLVVNTQLSVKAEMLDDVRDFRRIGFLDFSKNVVLAGSVNGVVCVAHSREMRGGFVGLWNPGINMWKAVRLLEPRGESDWWCGCDVVERASVGLGFDEVKGDFRIVRIVPVLGRPGFKEYSWSRVELYSANSDSWKDIGKKMVVPFWPKLPNCSFVVGGVPYWVGVDEYPEEFTRREMLGRIDPCSGLCKKVEYPEHVKNRFTYVHPVKLKESVAVLIQCPGKYVNSMVDLYVLDEKAADWTKIHTIGPLPFDGLRIPQCLSTGEIVLETWDADLPANLVPFFCDPETGDVLYNNAMDALRPLWYESYSHVESLVAIKGMELILKEDNKEKTRPRKKSWTESLSKDFKSVLHF